MKTITSIFLLAVSVLSVLGGEPFFPKGSVSDFEQGWYAKHLSAMKEPVLPAEDINPGKFALRVLYLPTWGRPVAFRYEARDGHFLRRFIMLSGDGGYDPGKIKSESTKEIGEDQIQAIFAALDQTGFWKLPVDDKVIGLDGSQLIVETIKDGKYQVRVALDAGT